MSTHYRGSMQRHYSTMLPTPSVSRRRTCAPSVRYPNVSTVAAIILLVSCLYHIRGFVPPRSQAAPLDRIPEDAMRKVPVDGVVREDDGRTLAADGLMKHDTGSTEGDTAGEVDVVIKEREETGEGVEIEDRSNILQEEKGLRDILPGSSGFEINDGVVAEGGERAGGRDLGIESESPLASTSSREDSVREDVQTAVGDTSENKGKTINISAEEVTVSDKDVAVDSSAALSADLSEKDELVSGATSQEGLDTVEKEESTNAAVEDKANAFEEVREEGATMDKQLRDETELVSANHPKSFQPVEKIEDNSKEDTAATVVDVASEEVPTREALKEESNSPEKVGVDGRLSGDVSRVKEGQPVREGTDISAVSEERDAVQKNDMQGSDESSVGRKVEKLDSYTLESDSLDAVEKNNVQESNESSVKREAENMDSETFDLDGVDAAEKNNIQESDELAVGKKIGELDSDSLDSDELNAAEKNDVQGSNESAVKTEVEDMGSETLELDGLGAAEKNNIQDSDMSAVGRKTEELDNDKLESDGLNAAEKNDVQESNESTVQRKVGDMDNETLESDGLAAAEKTDVQELNNFAVERKEEDLDIMADEWTSPTLERLESDALDSSERSGIRGSEESVVGKNAKQMDSGNEE
eukprot:GFKZ01010028.1.p1 GENE.GFKZ01010028.1~~GFKZ01010028.1.p1  ORF type:complete len:643 (+),score=163.73 GFKZ01010028.1:231-2159(+)